MEWTDTNFFRGAEGRAVKFSRFLSYHPYVSFSGSSSTFLMEDSSSPGWSACDTELSDDARKLWHLGKRAFQHLEGFENAEHFDKIFCNYQSDIRNFACLLHDNSCKFEFKGDVTGTILTPDFSEMQDGYPILDVLHQISFASGENSDHLAYYFILACLQEIDSALILLCLDGGAADSIISATLALQRAEELGTASARLQRARSEFSALGAIERHKRDPKQTDKIFVKECWLAWRANKSTYKGKAPFARDMLQKCENLQSTKVIEDWCREWEKQAETGTLPAK